MKRILITGANSYIGTSFENFICKNYPADYVVDTVDMIGDAWRQKDFSGYDAVLHVAGIAHQKETKQNAHLYYEINADLAIETASKAKAEGVKQFIFLSTMGVYGKETGKINKSTPTNPKTNYSKAKLEAENGINELASENFKVCVLRPPMVYGDGCRGNYTSVVKIVKKLPFFPRVNNKRSSIYIDNLIRFIKMAADRELSGLYFPQNKEYANTKDLAARIAAEQGKKIYFSRALGLGVIVLRPFISILRKAFGNLVYEGTEDFDFCYCEEK